MSFSLNIGGAPADNWALPSSLDVDDQAAVLGGYQRMSASGETFLCRGPDGSSAYYTIDAERSRPEIGLRILKKV